MYLNCTWIEHVPYNFSLHYNSKINHNNLKSKKHSKVQICNQIVEMHVKTGKNFHFKNYIRELIIKKDTWKFVIFFSLQTE